MHRQRIEVQNGDDYYEVDAYCAGGDEGVFAVYEKPGCPKLIEYACGDDGHWWFEGEIHRAWIPQIIQAFAGPLDRVEQIARCGACDENEPEREPQSKE